MPIVRVLWQCNSANHDWYFGTIHNTLSMKSNYTVGIILHSRWKNWLQAFLKIVLQDLHHQIQGWELKKKPHLENLNNQWKTSVSFRLLGYYSSSLTLALTLVNKVYFCVQVEQSQMFQGNWKKESERSVFLQCEFARIFHFFSNIWQIFLSLPLLVLKLNDDFFLLV